MAEVSREETRLVAEETARKMRREGAVAPAIMALFNQITKVSGDLYAATGDILSAERFSPAWKALLERHYRITGNLFVGEAFDTTPSPAFRAVLSTAITEWADKHSTSQAALITKTNTDEISEAYRAANRAIDEVATVPPGPARNQAVSRLGKRNLATRFQARVPVIAQTETQTAAETAKALEARATAGREIVPQQPDVVEEPSRIVKKWVAVGDRRTRHNHAAANGQEVDEEKPFLVGGDRLMYPGDGSLGAKLANIINCRCNAIYSVK